MPYLDSMIEKHIENCGNPIGKRLYIRGYDDKGKQRFISWGLTCTTCGVVIKQKYEHTTLKQLKARELDRKLEHYPNYSMAVAKFRGPSWQEQAEIEQKEKIAQKLKRLERKKHGPITPTESGLRRRIRNLKQFYTWASPNLFGRLSDISDNKRKSIEIVWDDNLVEQFLNLNPRPTMTELKEVFVPPDFIIKVGSAKHRRKYAGYVPISENEQKKRVLRMDKYAYIEILKSEANKRIEMMREIIQKRKSRIA